MAANDKDTIYIDIDDEITGIIDKLRGSHGKVVALVLPKRATVLQSIVNMKLLKRAADTSKKHLVLITTEAGLLPLAGAAGVHVAKTLTSKPEIPMGPDAVEDNEEMVEEDDDEITSATAGERPVGELAGAAAAAPLADNDEVETVELDDDEAPEEAASKPAKKPAAAAKKDKKLKVPNFDRFRLLLVVGGLALILLIVGIVFATSVLPKATITIKTDASNVDANLNVNLSTAAKTVNESNNTIPAKQVSQQKTYTGQANATGQQNNGNKASGSVTITLKNCSVDSVTIPSGTGISAGSQTYITQDSVTLDSVKIGNSCNPPGSSVYYSKSVDVTAQSGGAQYNISSGTSMSVAGFSNTVNAKASSNISGGTDNIVQTVTQTDINNAKAKINLDDSAMKQNLQNQLKQDNYYPIVATYSTGTPAITNSANPGDAANSVTVTEVVTYTMFGAQEDDLNQLIDNSIKSKIDTGKQSILSRGLDEAVFSVNSTAADSASLSLATKATVGPELDVASIRRNAAGKKPGEVRADLQNNPDVTDIDVKLSPFWVSSVPKKEGKITVNIAKPDNNTSKNAN